MPYIPEAFTDATPAAVVYRDRLYVAYKDSNSQRIWLASTDDPGDDTSWRRAELTMSFSGAGPGMILTTTGPALSVVGNSLWLAFKGHNNDLIWLISMTGAAYQGHGALPNVQTHESPSLAGPLIVHRGAEDQRIWYKVITTPGRDNRIPHESASTSSPPAVANMANDFPMVAFRSAQNNDLMYTFAIGGPHGTEWTVPARILDAESHHAPALALHDGTLFLAFKSCDDDRIHIASFGPHPWTDHGLVPGQYTSRGPALVSFGRTLWVVCKGHNNNRVWYREAPVDTYHYSVEIDYRPNPNGFSFVNFSEGTPDWDTFRDTFGHREIDAAATAATFDFMFAMFSGGLYALLFHNFYAVYRGFTDGTFNTGMCSAYAASSLRRYWDGTSPSLYSELPAATSAAALPSGIRRELTVDFGRLLGGETLTDLLDQCEAGQASVGRTLNAVREDLVAGSGLRSGRVVFFVPAGRVWDSTFLTNLSETHAVVPYKIDYPVSSSDGPIRMYVYDCNHPGNNSSSNPNGYSYIEFTADGHGTYTFTFFTGDTSSAASELSSANGFTLASMTLQDYLFRDITLPFNLNFVVDLLNCPAELRIRNSEGKMTGQKGKHIHWEIPGSYPLYPSAKGFLLPRGKFSREIWGTGDGTYSFCSLNPDGSGVLVHGLARGGSRPSHDVVTIDRTARTVSIQSEAGPQRCTVALSRAAAGTIRLVSLTNIKMQDKAPLMLTYSEELDSVRATYDGPGHDIGAEVFHAHKGEQSPRKADVQIKLEKDKALKLTFGYGPQLSIRE